MKSSGKSQLGISVKEKIAVGRLSVHSKYDVRIYIRSPFHRQFLEDDDKLVLVIVKIPENEEEHEMLKMLIRESEKS